MFVCSGAAVDVSAVPKEIKILPMGKVKSRKGDFIVDAESAVQIQEHFKGRGIDLVVDYEHQTLKDVQAPAAGWIKDIYPEEDSIVAKVQWTERAKEYLKNKEYRYLSPVVMVKKSDNHAAYIHSVALTNTPAIDGMFALVNSLETGDMAEDLEEEKREMDLKKLIKMLGLPEDATEAQAEAALAAAGKALKEAEKNGGEKEKDAKDGDAKDGEAAKEPAPAANPVVLSLLGLGKDAKTEDVAAAIMSLKVSGGNDEILALREELKESNAEAMAEEALKAGKITAAQKEWAKSYALSDKEGFKAFVEKAPAVVPMGKMALKDAPAEKEKKLDVDMQILKNCGQTEEDVKKYYREG